MLSIGPGSACDVCLEPFGPDVKVPCSIQCGHVFCVTCLHQMVQLSCPLCRNHFDQRTVVKLHVDMDTVVSTCPTSAQQEARRLQESIANVANEGTTETRLRQLIADATAFLATQPRDMFSDLRVTHRMIAYLCEVKSRQRIQRGELEEHKLQIAQLNTEKEELAREKEELLRSIEVAASTRRDEKETALAVELSLREHCSRAHAAYGTMVETYNYLVGEWMKLQEEVKRLREAEGLHVSDLRIPMADTRRSPVLEPTLYSPSSSASAYEMKLSTAVISEPDSFFVSPLPEFSNKGLSTVSMDLFSLPDVEYEVENKPHRAPPGKDSICDSKYHPTACRCVRANPAYEAPHSLMVASTPGSRSRGSSVVDRPSASDPSIDRSPIYVTSQLQSAPSFNDDNPRYRPQRTNSRSSRHSSLSRPPSRPPTRPSSPSRRSVSSQQSNNRIPSPMDAATSPRANMTLPQSGPNKVNNPRLHDLLQDSTSAATSSSLPNMTSHFPPAISRDSHSSRSRDHIDSPTRSRSRSVSGHRSSLPPPPQVREAHPASVVPDPPPQTITPPASTYMNPGTAVSTASNAASLLEKAKRERRKAEEEERLREREKAEKEQSRRDRERERDRERDRGGRERAQAERDRDAEREREKAEKEQRREEKRTRERQTSSASSSYHAASAHREQPSNFYAGAAPTSVSYSSQRISASSSSRSGSGTLRDSYNVHKHTTNALPVLGTTRV